MPRTNVFDPEAICQNCGRVEVSGNYCTYCIARPFEGIVNPSSLDVSSVRLALVNLHGWESEALCPEVRREPGRVLDHATDVGIPVSAFPQRPADRRYRA